MIYFLMFKKNYILKVQKYHLKYQELKLIYILNVNAALFDQIWDKKTSWSTFSHKQ